jgi:DNA-binding NarL/FixJ family response regulator
MQTISECLQKGAAGYIVKGEDHEELVNRVNLLIRLRKKS